MTDSKKPENPTFSTEMTDKQRTEVRGETPRGAKVEQGAQMSQETVDANVERDSSAGLQGEEGWKGVNYDKKSEQKEEK
ncbi:hypothetical protein [Deinococcus marmoris]|uniref:hypothetical protein n=1 Tax=Deinococcus marmoris TaxID=249408 RepID=UPI000496A487|nr:hypothetical protein [Deinococcus marmoris]